MPGTAPKTDDESQTPIPRRWIWLGALALVIVTALAYSNAFTVPFLFDDDSSIAQNKSIHDWRTVLFPPGGTGDTVAGRPLLNVSLALNYAISGLNVWSYHLLNVLIHLCSALALFGLVRRALAKIGWSGRNAFFCALAATALWMLHPLQTEAVTYIVQRAESLMSMLYLLTLYCFARAMQGEGKAAQTLMPVQGGITVNGTGRSACATFWLAASVFFCALGMAAKEVMVSAPVMVFLYDRAFVAGSFKEAWRARWKFYVVLDATWLVLAACLLNSGFRGGTAGFSTPVTWWMYAITQCKAILIYIKLVFWPSPLVFDYGMFFITEPSQVKWQIVVVSLLVAAALVAMFRFPRAGIFGALFFAVLAPTSSFMPVLTQPMAEHRMYLPSAAVIVSVVTACAWAACRARARHAAVVAACAVALVLGALTWRRNQVYQDEVSLWTDTVNKAPRSYRAQYNIGDSLIEAKRYEEAIPYYQRALSYMGKTEPPDAAHLLLNLALAMHKTGRGGEARKTLEDAFIADPKNASFLDAAGDYEYLTGNYAGAKEHYLQASEADPSLDKAWYGLGNASYRMGDTASAIKYYRQTISTNPFAVEAHGNLGSLLAQTGQWDEAIAELKTALRMNPDFGDAQYNLANALAQTGRDDEARGHYEAAIRLIGPPRLAQAHYNYASLLKRAGEIEAARAQAQEALKLRPDYPDAADFLKTLPPAKQ